MSKKTKKARSGSRTHVASGDQQKQGTPPQTAQGGQGWFSNAAIRETVESVVIAFVLAFLFRTFEAEAFVIPTGSMATTLMGRHKELECEGCGYWYRASASDEVDPNTNRYDGDWVKSTTCPMCRYTMEGMQYAEKQSRYPSYYGDRILVNKFAYEFADPRRWDIAVFKFPGGAKTNYIKRLVGMPGETVRIAGGDIYTKRGQQEDFTIARKPPHKLRAMLQTVFDNEVMPAIIDQGWPSRWRISDSGWTTDDHLTFHNQGDTTAETWLRYEHLVPTQAQWVAKRTDTLGGGIIPEPKFISDFCAYNAVRNLGSNEASVPPDSGRYWVGDLAVECSVDVRSDSGQFSLLLVEGGREFVCRIDVATGEATLSIVGELSEFSPKAKTAIRGKGKHEIVFSNCDDQLLLWVDGDVVTFDEETTYSLPYQKQQSGDLQPVRIGSKGATVSVGDLKVLRDIYYIADNDDGLRRPRAAIGVFQGGTYSKQAEFVMEEDQFLALGDNSARSKDGRLWGAYPQEFPYGVTELPHYVSRDLLIGKAMFIYWPHSWDKLPGTDIPFPFFPNFAGMGLVR